MGTIVGAVGYTAYTAISGTQFNTGTMLLAAGGGMAAGALIGTGVGWAAGAETAETTFIAVTGSGVLASTASTALKATGGDPTDEISSAAQGFGALSRAADYGIQQASQLKSAIENTGLQAHHIIE